MIERFLANRGSKEFSLDKVRRIVEVIGRPHEAFPVFHITGTNGKGSVSCSIAGMLGAHRKRVVLTISPHLSRVNERVIRDGSPINDTSLEGHLRLINNASESLGVSLSLHEAMTLAAFVEGQKERVDYGVLEVGVGGRLDSTNIAAEPVVGVITSISLDHTDILGDSLELIAGEKAGIIKKTMKALVVGQVPQSVLKVFDLQSSRYGVPVLAFGRDFWVKTEADSRSTLQFNGENYPFSTPLAGGHQIQNAALALTAALVEGLDPDICQIGLSQIYWPARLESVSCSEKRRIILDSAHNPGGVRFVADYVKKSLNQRIDCVFGSLNTKDWRSMVDLLYPITRQWYLLTPPSECAVPSAEIAAYLSCLGVNSHCLRDETDLLDGVLRGSELEQATATPLMVLGSMYLIGAVRRALNLPDKPYWRLGRDDRPLPVPSEEL